MQNIPINFHDDTTCVKVYNPKEQKLIGVYKNYWKAGKGLGVDPDTVFKKCNSKNRLQSPLYNMEVACRLAPLTEDNQELIELTIKKRNQCQTL